MLKNSIIICLCFAALFGSLATHKIPHEHDSEHKHHHGHHHHHHRHHHHEKRTITVADNEVEDSNVSNATTTLAELEPLTAADGENADLIDGTQEEHEDLVEALNDESENDAYCEWYKCDKDLRQPQGFSKYFDVQFLKKFVRNLSPFSRPRLQMRYYLFTREFPDCGRELLLGDKSLETSGFNATLPTRIIIHGWMSQSRGSFNRDVKNAYLQRGNYNVIVTDWSVSAANLNYFAVVRMIESLGAQLAHFTQYLHENMQLQYDDVYLIGHSLGAQIAGAAGKRIKPEQYNTIFALDPAGPKFRKRSIDFRIDPTDAKYVESIQTSANLGFLEPTGNATFYPNYGVIQRKCFYIGCSHIRAYKMFAESINSDLGFWGHRCQRQGRKWDCEDGDTELYQMGGEPSGLKTGIFYVDTKASEPFAMGREAATVQRR